MGHFGVTWEPLRGYFGTLGSHFGALWRQFRLTLGSYWDDFGTLWFDFEYMRVTWESLWSNFKKYSFSPIDFNDFINSSGHFRTDLGSFGGHFAVIFGK